MKLFALGSAVQFAVNVLASPLYWPISTGCIRLVWSIVNETFVWSPSPIAYHDPPGLCSPHVLHQYTDRVDGMPGKRWFGPPMCFVKPPGPTMVTP